MGSERRWDGRGVWVGGVRSWGVRGGCVGEWERAIAAGHLGAGLWVVVGWFLRSVVAVVRL